MNNEHINSDAWLWEEKWRPQTLDDVILQDGVKNSLKEYAKQGQIPNLLFSSVSGGTGKTTSAYALCHDLGIERPLFINASIENSINDIRTKVLNFATTVSLLDRKGSHKVVILDECLEENQEVMVGEVSRYGFMPLKDMVMGETYPVVSFNMETGEYENDTAELISEKDEEVFEVTLEDGSIVVMTANHPAIIHENGEFVSRNLTFGLKVGDEVVIK